MSVLVFVDLDRGALGPTATQAFGLAVDVANGAPVIAVAMGSAPAEVATALGAAGASTVTVLEHEALDDYAPEAWGDALAQIIGRVEPAVVLATGNDRGNEVLAHAAAVLDLPFAANVLSLGAIGPTTSLTRVRWGGSLIEHAELLSERPIVSTALHAFAAPEGGAVPVVETMALELSADAARTRIVDRITVDAGITLQTAPVVVSGGRGVGSAEGFAALEQFAALVGGAVGCSRVVTNQGWRPHSDQVGQTGKRVAPELYVACGISGAIQHWIGMQAASTVLAINIDAAAPMVAKADYAVIGDLHDVVPAIVAALERRRPRT